MKTNKNLLAIAITTSLASGFCGNVYAQEVQGSKVTSEDVEKISVIGSRVKGRGSLDTAAPVDVISGEDFVNQGSNDVGDLLRTVVPSYNVSAQPISDAATFVRPANLRGLAPDHTLVLLNGKRRHRSAVIAFYGAGLSDGAQGPDISVFPTIALKQVSVLRDGAAAQYGSDAIAGVMDFALKDASEGGTFEVKVGQFYEGDGGNYQFAGNIGLPLTDTGFLNLSAEYGQSDPTDRSVQRDDAQALIDAGNTEVPTPAQIWGSPEVQKDLKLTLNAAIDNDDSTFYAFGNYANKIAEAGLYYRNPNSKEGVFTQGDNQLVADLDGIDNGVSCPIFLAGDSDGLSQVMDNSTEVGANCFAFNEIFSGGFTPSMTGETIDLAGVMGVKGYYQGSDLYYDASVGGGYNKINFAVDSINPSYGPNTPLHMDAGSYIQLEKNINIDLSYPIAVDFFESDLNVAGGFEWREEQFEAIVGDPESYNIGPLSDQGFSSGSQGYIGLSEVSAGNWDRSNIALYIDLEANITENLLVALAGRWEDFDDFGTTSNGKLSLRWDINDEFAFRSTISNGFRAPTPGQANISNVSSVLQDGVIVNSGIIPPTTDLAVRFGASQLQPEKSTSFSFGSIMNFGDLSITVDYFNIEVEDRIAISNFISLTPEEAQGLEEQGIAGASEFANFRYYTNDFDTTTRGVDIVASYPFNLFDGDSNISLVANWTKTEVEDSANSLLDETRIRTLEEGLPNVRGNINFTHSQGDWRALARVNYFGDYYIAHLSYGGFAFEPGAEITVDFELGYSLTEQMSVTLGASNLFDESPDENPFGNFYGAKYPEFSPMGINGGMYYLSFKYEM
jgi:iron complex outermembrane receptor protein